MADVRLQADAAITTFLPILATKQAAYLARVGIYWQGLETHITTPTGGTATAPTLSRHPTDQIESWTDEGYSFLPSSFSFIVNTYNGPNGQGYELVTKFLDSGGLWKRIINIGPEIYREQLWTFSPVVII